MSPFAGVNDNGVSNNIVGVVPPVLPIIQRLSILPEPPADLPMILIS